MTVENLHDAIGQLPSDLIAAADERRSRKPKVIPLKRYIAMAACLVLVLGSSFLLSRLASGGAKETAAIMQAPEEANVFGITEEDAAKEAAPEEPAAMAGDTAVETYTAEEVPPEGVTEETWVGYPEFPAEDVQYADTRNVGTACTVSDPVIRVLRSRTELETFREDFGYYDLEAFDDCCTVYDESWFAEHDLLVVLVKEKFKDGSLSLASVTESDGDWCIRFYSGGPYTGERIDRFVLATLEKDLIPEGSHLFAMFEVP